MSTAVDPNAPAQQPPAQPASSQLLQPGPQLHDHIQAVAQAHGAQPHVATALPPVLVPILVQLLETMVPALVQAAIAGLQKLGGGTAPAAPTSPPATNP